MVVVDEVVLETPEDGPQEGKPSVQFTDSEDDVKRGNFLYGSNDPERIVVGLNSSPVVEEQHSDEIGEETDSDHSYDLMSEELNTDYLSDEENPVRYPMFNEEKEMWDPQFK
ncbi:Uncharacterized protein Adt_10404 [Abeliophyllum distichum]|uniref:Uncharacterized protein n=1 Tax=Abeliophyllum distichum TaxID=126358 RepID=A0ABD1ULC3_9LAMI